MACLPFIAAICAAFLAATNSPPVVDLGHGAFRIGEVTLNRQNKTVSFPTTVNMSSGVIEYVVVTSGGKTHESVLKTDVEPFHLHSAMLLLGAKVAREEELGAFTDAKQELPGQKLTIQAEWNGKRVPLEALVFNVQTKKPMEAPFWVYNGSVMREGQFLAQREGSIVSLISDPSALANNPREDRENDELWVANTNTVPAVGTPVQVTFQFLPSAGSEK